MALTMELFTIHGRGANGSNCVCVYVCAHTLAVRMSEREWWNHWSTQWLREEEKGEGDWRRSTEWCLLKWKIMPWCRGAWFCPLGEVTTSMLALKCSEILSLWFSMSFHCLPVYPPLFVPLSFLPQFSPGSVQVQMAICCTSPTTCFSALACP